MSYRLFRSLPQLYQLQGWTGDVLRRRHIERAVQVVSPETRDEHARIEDDPTGMCSTSEAWWRQHGDEVVTALESNNFDCV